MIETPDGASLKYALHGAGTESPPLLLMNGLLSTTTHWEFMIPHYARTRRVLAWDYRGHGGLPAPQRIDSVSVTQFAEDAEVVRRAALGDERVVLVGLSFGVQVALEYYRRNAHRVAAMVLICGVEGHPLNRVSGSPLLRRAVVGAVKQFGRGGRFAEALLRPLEQATFVREIAYLTGGAHRTLCPPELVDRILRHTSAMDPRVVSSIVASFVDHNAMDVLPMVRVPTLILGAGNDELAPLSRLETLQRGIAGSSLRMVDGHTHMVQIERPAEVHRLMDEFFNAL